MRERVELKTKEGVALVADYYPGKFSRGVLLLHMMPADRKSWSIFADKLNGAGFQVLAVDLRGHGESQGGPDGFKKFSDEEHQNSINDVVAAAEFLKTRGIDEFYLAGASIGANLAFRYLAEHGDTHAAVLLSPGLDYRGIRMDLYIGKLKESQKVYFVASDEDKYSYESVGTLVKKLPHGVAHEIKCYENAGHGTAMFAHRPELMDELVSWFSRS